MRVANQSRAQGTQCPLTKTRMLPAAASQPRFSDLPNVNSCFVMRSILQPNALAISKVLSVEPESTTIVSSGTSNC